jgi:uncharacterized protein YkwD
VEATTARPSYPCRFLVLAIACAIALPAAGAPASALAISPHHKPRASRCANRRGHHRPASCRGAHHAHASRSRSLISAVLPRPATLRTLAGARPASCANADLTPTPGNLAEIKTATFCLINQQRAKKGLQPLKDNGRLDDAAEQHSEDMVTNDYFDHTEPSGETFDSRIMTSGYVPRGWDYMLGENIAMGTLQLATPAAIVDAWMASPEHRANILADFRDSGIGVVAQAPAEGAGSQPGATYTEEFGAVQASS